MTKSFSLRLTASLIGVVMLALLIMASLAIPVLERTYLSDLEQNLAREAKLTGEVVSPCLGDRTALERIARSTSGDTGARVTIIAPTGMVLADSQENPLAMANHANRPEVREALAGRTGISRRYSETIKMDMLYVAVPVWAGSHIAAVARLAVPLTQVSKLEWFLAGIVILALLVAALAGTGLGILFSRRLSRPISLITRAAEEMASGHLSCRVHDLGEDDIGQLARAFNTMAESLEQNMRDISQVKNRLELVLDTTVNGIMLLDVRGRIEYANPAFARMFITGDRNLTGSSYMEITGSYDLSRLVDAVVGTGERQARQVTMYSRGERVVEAHGVPVFDDDAALKGVLVVLNDISELKRLEQVRKDFVANVSHELKTPIAAISGFAETLMNEPDDVSTVREFSEIIYSEACRMDRTVKNLLNLARLETGRVDLALRPVDMGELVAEASQILRERGLVFDLERQGDATVNADHDLLLQVFLNLFDNAIKYSLEKPVIAVDVSLRGNRVVVAVTDQGVGIPESDQKRVFERFYRVDKARSRQTGGVGLGLAIVRHIIEVHGGTTGVTSIPGKGTTVYFTLPVAEPEE